MSLVHTHQINYRHNQMFVTELRLNKPVGPGRGSGEIGGGVCLETQQCAGLKVRSGHEVRHGGTCFRVVWINNRPPVKLADIYVPPWYMNRARLLLDISIMFIRFDS